MPLLTTCQTVQDMTLDDGREVTIFDHPFSGDKHIICNQGSAFPTGPQQTCGCCASGTIINKARGNTNEHGTVTYALNHQLCTAEGYTNVNSWIGILDGAGIGAHNFTGSTLKELSQKVENGQGVIIAVSACSYAPEMYGHYFPGKADGHAIVLESVIRDRKTGKIVEYVVSDSNGSSAASAMRRVKKSRLERAFRRKGKQAVVTDEVIW